MRDSRLMVGVQVRYSHLQVTIKRENISSEKMVYLQSHNQWQSITEIIINAVTTNTISVPPVGFPLLIEISKHANKERVEWSGWSWNQWTEQVALTLNMEPSLSLSLNRPQLNWSTRWSTRSAEVGMRKENEISERKMAVAIQAANLVCIRAPFVSGLLDLPFLLSYSFIYICCDL